MKIDDHDTVGLQEALRRYLEDERASRAKGEAGGAQEGSAAEGARQREGAREKALAAVLAAGVTFWRDQRGDAYATVSREGRIERHAVRSRSFKNIVRLLYGDANPVRRSGMWFPGALPDQALAEVLGAFEARALRGEEREPRARLCRAADGTVWLDLGRPDWSLVRITKAGWEIVPCADVPLIRPPGLLALPVPQRVPDALLQLRSLLNMASGENVPASRDVDFMLTVSWLAAALYPEGPYPILALDGEQGSGKSTASRILRRLVDPNLADIRSLPRDERDLAIAAGNGRIVAFDNLSSLHPDMADALCRVATGSGLGERALYTNGDEHIAFVQAPVLLNGIPSLLARGDLADRAIAITLPAIPDDRRRPEAEVWRDFHAAAPGILALLLDALVLALRDAPTLHLPRLPRMADFARVACAAAPAFGWTPEAVLAAMEENRAGAVISVIEADPIAAAIQALASERAIWTGTATELLAEINTRTPPERQRERDWPKDATRLSARLRRVAPALRRAGVEVRQERTGAARMVSIKAVPTKRAAASSASPTGAGGGEPGDAMTLHDANDAGAPFVRAWSPGGARDADDAGEPSVGGQLSDDEVVL